MMSRRWTTGFLLLALAGLTLRYVQGDPQVGGGKTPHAAETALMRAKVGSSQKILEGLVSKDFVEIKAGALELKRICQATEWEGHTDSQYSHYRQELVRQTSKLATAADDTNLDGAAFAYFNAVTICIHCHDHCRDVLKIAKIKKPSKIIPIPTTDSDDVPPGEQTNRR
ncbi:MAG: hypothetical protein JSS02_17365 [Planctomycetes bacterium]|nr:hypothetical protein [Planctomycetota bacterium]